MGVITTVQTATIANTANLSNAVYLGAKQLVALQTPAVWTAASLSFQASFDGITYTDVYDAQGIEYTVACDISRVIPIDDRVFSKALLYIKIRSGLTGAPITQLQASPIDCLTRAL